MATDFTAWDRSTLEQFAREAADENLVLRENNKALHTAWRQAIAAQLQPLGAGSSLEAQGHPPSPTFVALSEQSPSLRR